MMIKSELGRLFVMEDALKSGKITSGHDSEIYRYDDIPHFYNKLELKRGGDIPLFGVDQTEEKCLESVRKNGFNLKYVNRQTEKICLEAIRENPSALALVQEQSLGICMEAVRRDGLAIRFVKRQDHDLCLLAILQNPESIVYVRKQTYDVCEFAVRADGNVLEYVRFEDFDASEQQKLSIYWEAILSEPCALRFVKDQTLDLCREAFQRDLDSWIYIRDMKHLKYIVDEYRKVLQEEYAEGKEPSDIDDMLEEIKQATRQRIK